MRHQPATSCGGRSSSSAPPTIATIRRSWRSGLANKRRDERITLNYVLPDARFRGVSRALLAALERRAAERGNGACTLTSTATARRFYLANGYEETGAARGNFGTQSGFPMRRALK